MDIAPSDFIHMFSIDLLPQVLLRIAPQFSVTDFRPVNSFFICVNMKREFKTHPVDGGTLSSIAQNASLQPAVWGSVERDYATYITPQHTHIHTVRIRLD